MIKLLISMMAIAILSSCASYEKFKYITEEMEIPSQIYSADFNQTWQAVLQISKNFDIEMQNQEAGVLKTRWMDNTNSLNFSESFGQNMNIKAAKYKLIINVVKGFKGPREVTKVTIYKKQLIEQDFLQGWKEKFTDGILERTLLYRLGRKIWIDNRLKEIDKAREKEQLNAF